MSEQNVELHRRGIEAFNRRDIEGVVALCDPSVEWHSTFGGGAIYRGHDGLRAWHKDLQDAWGTDIRIEPEVFFDLGEHTLDVQLLHGRGRQSGADVALSAASVIRWRDGLIVYFKGYADQEDALSDLGISEDELEPIAP